ncbi:hypothetical protein BDV23DRAFT_193528 [Aspergillus alliaceus]|uniref:SMODS and SLOG-associating 2TM effector domain-containing protein n=1 Tax=Petromyces alliaceus TaxID=209559 RepID=A0A5N7C9D9_PETAA|nr:hypothetical protein BDV23DRAFT_193528 [Aspergillus alliaceus]
MSNSGTGSASQPAEPGPPREERRDYQTFNNATNELYNRLRQQENSQCCQYHLISIFFNALAILQVMIGATITALGPFGGSHLIAITVLGAVNTVVAGLIALLKGRGLPQRPRKNMVELGRVRKYIEEQKTLLQYGNGELSRDELRSLLEDVIKRYNLAEDTIERNQPDTYANAIGASRIDEETGG